jgi:hypothetical protein
MIMPYIVPPIWRKGWYKKENQPEFSYRIRLRYGVPALWLIMFTGFLNPNGLEGMKYLSSSADLISTGKVISEMNSASLTNPIGLMVLLEVLLFGIAASQKKLSAEQTWLTLGTCLLAIDAYRNAYMIVFGISILVIVLMGEDDAIIKNKCETSQRNYSIIKVMYIIASIAILAVMISNFITEDTEGQIDMMDSALSEQVQYLKENEADRDKEDLVLYTVFETGQYFQFNGYKTYIDARPECYMKTINGQEDIWSEFYDIVNGLASTDEEIQAFLDKYNFDYLCTGRVGHIGAYLRASDDYEEVVYGANYSLFKNISKSTDTTVTEQTEEKSLEESETEVTTEIVSETAASN